MTRTFFALPLLAVALFAQPPGVRTVGSPMVIDQSGSYMLTNSLFTSSSTGAGITITASDVTLLGAPQKLTTSTRIDLTTPKTDRATWHGDGRYLPHPRRRRVSR